ncbi:MAG: hypothetical protein JRG91_14815 [Deltaproteobacteria bacterium]|nr:hypothetical protein [Deltaproteobacteria bacterium]
MSVKRTNACTAMAALLALVTAGCPLHRGEDSIERISINGDEDGDGILNGDEGYLTRVDTDGDGVPDFEDEDSDGDGIADSVEAGDHDTRTPPVDSDWDGIPDYRDLDSDANGILDEHEEFMDTDMDGILDFADRDDDGDAIPDDVEISDSPHDPPDSDGDGTPDFRDLDSDGDTISDADEGVADTDGDTIRDYLDLDTDGDGIPDDAEAGDASVSTPPEDVDGDGRPNYRDLDSDGDGLSDAWEVANGCNPFSDDTDADGVPDLVEVSVCPEACTGAPCPGGTPGYTFVMPYNLYGTPEDELEHPHPFVQHVVLETDTQAVDVFFAVSTSFSMNTELFGITSSLRSTVMPGIRADASDVWFGLGRLEDCMTCSHNMAVLQTMTADLSAVEAELTGWTSCGSRVPFTQYLYALASGDVAPFLGWGGVTPTSWTCPGGGVGWACFRRDALPIVVQFGDQAFATGMSGCSPSKDHGQAVSALNAISAKYVGIDSGYGGWSAYTDMVTIASGTGSFDTSGSPLVFTIPSDGSGLGEQLVDAVLELARLGALEVTYRLRDGPGDTVDTVRAFVDRVVPSVAGGFADPADPYLICTGGLHVADRVPPLDGVTDSFVDVPPGTVLCFDVHVKHNHTVMSTTVPQMFPCEIDAMVGGEVMDTRTITFFVPPAF